jgi:membrane protease YdiL (CAAX protease family)
MALGALFGYYFYWTGNIWLPVFGHCLNNGITLIGMYLYNRNMSPIDVEDPGQIPWYLGAVAAGVTWSLATMVKEEADKIRKIEK